MRSLFMSLAFASTLSLSLPLCAQTLPLPSGLPGLDMLTTGSLLPSSLLGPGGADAIPVLGSLLNGSAAGLGLGIVQQPTDFLSTLSGIGLPVVSGVVPLLDVLTARPTDLPSYLLNGGPLLSETLSPLPAILLLSVPF